MAQTSFLPVTLGLFVVISTLTSQTHSSVISMTSSHPNPAKQDHTTDQDNHHFKSHTKSRNSEKDTGDKASLTTVVDCPRGHFFSSEDLVCKPCSACPVNQIIRRPCSARADTQCGPFLEFDKFHQNPDDGVKGEGSRRHHKGGRHHGGRHHRHHKHEDSVTSEESGPEADLTSVTLDKYRHQWRTLSYALIIVLSVVCCIVVVVGIYVCVVCRRSREHKHLIRDPEYLPAYPDDDLEPRYVETFVTSRDRLRSSRHLPVYQQIYTGSDMTSEFPPLMTSSTTQLTKESMTTSEGDDGDQYIYFNLPSVNSSEV